DFLGGGDLPPFTLTFPAASVTSINLQSGGAADTININGLFANMPLSLDSGDAADTINIGNGNLDGIASNITFIDTIAGDNVNINANSGRLNVYGNNGLDNVRIGNAGSLAAINGVIYVNNVNNRSALIIDDFATSTSKNWLFNPSAVTNLAPAVINYVGS